MNIKIKLAGVLCCLTASSAYADYYTSSSSQSDDYYTSGSSVVDTHHRHAEKPTYSVSVNVPTYDNSDNFPTVSNSHRHELRWVNMATGDRLPMNAVVGGSQPVPRATLYICRANYRGGVHPGKLYHGRCNIGWGGEEISLTQYQVLTSRVSLGWVADSFGGIPTNAIAGGYQHDGPLYICQARFHGGLHPGKVVGENCNIGWGGREEIIPHYNVLVR